MYYCIEPRRGVYTRFHAWSSVARRDAYAKSHVGTARAMSAPEVRRRLICEVFNGYDRHEALRLSRRYGSLSGAKRSATMSELFTATLDEGLIGEVVYHDAATGNKA